MNFRNSLRLIFVVFSLYLLRDVFYRWDGFRYHSTFSEFLPSVALISILWSAVAVCTAILIWILLKFIEWICMRFGYEVRVEHFIVFTVLLIISGFLVWKVKRLLWPLGDTSQYLKITVFIAVFLLTVFLTWLFRDRANIWIKSLLERITPLVWLFGTLVLISVPLVIYHVAFKNANKEIAQKIDTVSVYDKKRPNILLVTFDALAAWDMELYGYKRETAPFITDWAKKAATFTNLQAASNWTTPTTASLMTGKRVWSHQAFLFKGGPPAKSSIESLPLLLKEHGYFNMAFVANEIASAKILGMNDSFNIAAPAIAFSTPHSLLGDGIEAIGIIDKLLNMLFADKIKLYNWIVAPDFILGKILSKVASDISLTTSPPEKVFNEFLTVLNNNPPEPYFAWIHVLPPHAPYLPSEPYLGMFDNVSEMRTFKSQWGVYQSRIKYHEDDSFPSAVQTSINILRSRYDEFIKYCDKKFEEFITLLTERNKLDNVIIIISADHGQSFAHAYLAHGGPHLYEQVTNIPLIIKEPMQEEKRIIHELAEQIDIPATITELAGIPMPSWMEGRSLVPLMRGKHLPAKTVFAMNFDKNAGRGQELIKGTVSVWEGDYKLIHYLEENKSLLFNLREDRNELNNIFQKESESGQRLLNLIYDNLEEANQRIISERDQKNRNK